MGIRRLHQLLSRQETQHGVFAPSIYTAAAAKVLVIEPSAVVIPEYFRRGNIARKSLSPLPPLAGIKTGQITYGVELAGHTIGGAPPWGVSLEACGFAKELVYRIPIGAITAGPFFAGEVITGGTSGATGRVFFDTFNGAPTLKFVLLTGTFAAEVLTGGTSGATATSSGVAVVEGQGYSPWTVPEVTNSTTTTLTGALPAGVIVRGQTSNAIAELVEYNSTANTVRLRPYDGIFTASETIERIDGVTGTLVLGANFTQLRNGTMSLVLAEDGGTAKEFAGCRGTVNMSAEIGQPMIMNYDMRGLVNDVLDKGSVVTTYEARTPPVLLGVTLRVGDDTISSEATESTPRLASIGFDIANTVGFRRDATDPNGVHDCAHITGRASTASMTIEAQPETRFPYIERLKNGEPLRVTLEIGTAAQNRFQIQAPSMYCTGESPGENEGFATRELSFDLASRAPDDSARDNAEWLMCYGTSAP